jgi:hypothetical protein
MRLRIGIGFVVVVVVAVLDAGVPLGEQAGSGYSFGYIPVSTRRSTDLDIGNVA